MSMDESTRTRLGKLIPISTSSSYCSGWSMALIYAWDRYHLIQLLCEGGFEALQTLLEPAQISTCLGETPSQGCLVNCKDEVTGMRSCGLCRNTIRVGMEDSGYYTGRSTLDYLGMRIESFYFLFCSSVLCAGNPYSAWDRRYCQRVRDHDHACVDLTDGERAVRVREVTPKRDPHKGFR